MGFRHLTLARAGFATVAMLAAAFATTPAAAQRSIKVALEGSLTGAYAPFLVADDRGFYRAEALDVTIEAMASPPDAISRVGATTIYERYGNLFDMYQRITDEDPYRVPMRIYPAIHYTMGGVWVDYNLMTSIPGLYCLGEANFSDHGANRLGASALMQGLADGYFVLSNTIRDYLADGPFDKIAEDNPAVVEAQQSVQARIDHFMTNKGTRSVDSYHRELGNIMWEYCGMERTETGLKKAIDLIRSLRDDFYRNVKVLGSAETLNQSLEKAGRVADFFELGELMCIDALNRRESCGGHFRGESQTEDGEALRHDDEYAYVAAWEWAGEDTAPVLHKEDLVYTAIEMKQRSYK